VVAEVLREAASSQWDAAVPDLRRPEDPSAPLLSGGNIAVDRAAVRRLLERLIEIASRSATAKMATLQPALLGGVDVAALFSASICQDGERVVRIAATSGADAEALQAVVALVAVPWLHACNRRWASSIAGTWMEGYCPVCGSWPAFAEMRGIERSRYLRCGRCGGGWHSHILHCGYCGTRDHDELTTLVPEMPGSPGIVEACRRCRGYVKAFTTLQGCPPATVMLQDLGSIDLDVAALEQGYTRPAGAGYTIEVMVDAPAAARRFFAWNA
jgi:FdhE protein